MPINIKKQSCDLSELVFECQARISERHDDVRPEVSDKDPDVYVSTV